MKTWVIRVVSGDPSHSPALPPCPSGHATCYHKPKHSLQAGVGPETCPPAAWPSWYPRGKAPTQQGFYFFLYSISFFWWSFISVLKGQNSPKPSYLLRDGSGLERKITASNGKEGLSHLPSHKLKPIHKTVCFVNTKVQHKAFRHQLNLNIIVFIVMNNKSFSTALQQQGIIQPKFNF